MKNILTILFFLLLCSKSFAETEDTVIKASKVEPIIITTEKIELMEGMVSSDSISGEDISKSPEKNIADITKTLPNVERVGGVRGSNSEFKIRGMEDTRITTKIDGSKVNFRGEYKGRNFISPFMLSEISVIRGSNSVTEGSGAIAGAINLKTKEVEDIALNKEATYGGELATSYGTNGKMQNYSGAAFTRKDGFSLLGMYSFTENKDFSTPNHEKINYTSGHTNNAFLKLKKKFNESESVKLSSSVFTENGDSTSNPFRIVNSGFPVEKSLANQRHSAEINLDSFNVKLFYDKTNIKEDAIKLERRDTTDFTSYGLNFFGNFKYKNKTFENLFIYGAEFVKDTQSGTRPGAERANLFPEGTSRNEGIYAENILKIKGFSLLFGARQDYYNLKANSKEVNHSSDILKKAVISYEIGGLFTPFVRYSEGYRAPLIKEMFASGNIVTITVRPGLPNFKLDLITNENLKPEYSQNYETGFKFLKENLFESESQSIINFTYFIQDVKNFIIQDPLCTTATCSYYPPKFDFQYQNLDKVRFKGIEVEAKYSSNSYLLSVAASTLKAYETGNNNSILQTPGKKLTIKAQKKFENGLSFGVENISASAVKKDGFRTYNLEVKPVMLQGISQPANGIFQTDCGPGRGLMLCEETKGYSITNFNVQYEKKSWLLGTSLNNAFNTEYKEQTSFIPGLRRNISVYTKIKM
jgi:hemoglobin/transferrin/lactoferrin receptor protein